MDRLDFLFRNVLLLLPVVFSALFLQLALRGRRPIAWAALVVWLLYTAYEAGMSLRILCSGECNIRVDLLLLYPALLVFSMIAARLGRPKRNTPGSPSA